MERGAATAYLTAIPKFKNRMLAKAAGSILGVETTHVALLAYTLKQGTEPYKDFVSQEARAALTHRRPPIFKGQLPYSMLAYAAPRHRSGILETLVKKLARSCRRCFDGNR